MPATPRRSSATKWAVHYPAYGQLKKVLRGPGCSPQEFVLALHREMARVSGFAEEWARQLLRCAPAEPPFLPSPPPPRREEAEEREELTRYRTCGEQFQVYLLISAVALFKIVLKYNKRRPPAEQLNALGILRSYPFQRSPSYTQRALLALTKAPPPLDSPRPPLTCGLCRKVFIDPVILNCGGHYCCRCVTRYFEAGLPCPGCQRPHPLDVDKAAMARWLAEIIQSHVTYLKGLKGGVEPHLGSRQLVDTSTDVASSSSSSSSSSNPGLAGADPSDSFPTAPAPTVATLPVKSLTTVLSVVTYCDPTQAAQERLSTTATRRTATLSAFLAAHRHVGLIALQGAFGAVAVGEHVLPDHGCVAESGLALFWHRPQFQPVAAGTVALGPDRRSVLLWARLEWCGGRRIPSLLVVTGRVEDGDAPLLRAALRKLRASTAPALPLLFGGLVAAAAADALLRAGFADCGVAAVVPVLGAAGPAAAGRLLSLGALEAKAAQLLDSSGEGQHRNFPALYAQFTALRSPAGGALVDPDEA